MDLPTPTAATRRALHAAVLTRLRDMIVEGELAPGTRLNERVLCERLEVSRTPLREAMKMLAAEGLLVLLPNRGAAVPELSADDVRHTFELMAALEAANGELACERITADELDEIRALHYEMLACYARRDLPGYYRRNAAIHNLINVAARNPALTQTYRTVNARIQALRFRSNFNREKWEAAVEEHEAMLDALAKRDGGRMRAILVQHLRHKCEAVLAELARGADFVRKQKAAP
jgi:DNA-binding GntR family transcriptional regulator